MLRRLLPLLCLPLLSSPALALSIQFDYSHDSSGFFTDPARRNLLNLAADSFTGFSDFLTPITPDSTNSWDAQFLDPSSGSQVSSHNLNIPTATVLVYVGSRDLGAGVLGEGGPGGFSASGTQSFIDNLSTRGQSGATQDPTTSTDFGPWGGSIAFSSTANFFFGQSSATLTTSQVDFLSVAMHELGHVLGFGTADSFKHWISGSTFTGPASESKFGGPVPLNSGLDHWAQGTMSTINGFRSQETAMDPALTPGQRKIFTSLDYAALTDVGWQVRVPGDANGDGIVNADDYALLDRGFAKHLSGWTNGDFNNDGVINSQDYLLEDLAFYSQTHQYEPALYASQIAQFGPSFAADLQALIPEPSSTALLLLSLPLLSRRRRAA